MRHLPAARHIALSRLLLAAMALAIVLLTIEGRQSQLAPEALWLARWLVAAVAVYSGVLVLVVHWTRRTWQLLVHLTFDVVWVALLCWVTGGVASPAVPLLVAIVLVGALTLPGAAPFFLPSMAGLALGIIATLSIAHLSPLTEAYLRAYPGVGDTNRIVGQLALQVGALFLVEALGQLLGRRLGEQRLFTREMLDQLGEGVVAIDAQGAIAYANDEAIRLLGLPEDDVTGQSAAAVLTHPAHERLRQRLQEGFSGMERHALPGGRSVLTRISRLHGRSGKFIGSTLLIADDGRVRLLEEHARRAEHFADLGAMAAGIAHEIRNPLASLRGCAQEIDGICRRVGEPDAQILAGIMLTEADRMARIVQDFLAFARQRKAELQEVSIAELVAEVEHLLRLRTDLPAGLVLTSTVEQSGLVQADRDQLKQVLMNLLINALDAVRDQPHPRITCCVTTAPRDNPLACPALCIDVDDNGPGVAPAAKPRLFTPFYSTKAQGTGLGLALASRIVREHEGLLSLIDRPHGGACFRIHLPLRSVTREFRRAAAPTGLTSGTTGDDGARFSPTGAE